MDDTQLGKVKYEAYKARQYILKTKPADEYSRGAEAEILRVFQAHFCWTRPWWSEWLMRARWSQSSKSINVSYSEAASGDGKSRGVYMPGF